MSDRIRNFDFDAEGKGKSPTFDNNASTPNATAIPRPNRIVNMMRSAKKQTEKVRDTLVHDVHHISRVKKIFRKQAKGFEGVLSSLSNKEKDIECTKAEHAIQTEKYVSAGDDIASILNPQTEGESKQKEPTPKRIVHNEEPSYRTPNYESTQAGIWRKHKSYSWIGSASGVQDDGTHQVADYAAFNAWGYNSSNADPFWQQNNEITLYDAYTKALEAEDINGNKAATKMDYRSRQVVVTAANAKYGEFAFSGAEYMDAVDDDLLDVKRGEGYVSTYETHSGKYSLAVASGKEGFTYTIPTSEVEADRAYEARVWVYLPNDAETNTNNQNALLYYTLGSNTTKLGIADVQIAYKARSWYLLVANIEPQAAGNIQSVIVSCRNNTDATPATNDEVDIYFDDFRVQPIDAASTAYVYDLRTGELNYTLNSENIYTRYRYDAHGRLTHVYEELIGRP